jgi:hypothetical protein
MIRRCISPNITRLQIQGDSLFPSGVLTEKLRTLRKFNKTVIKFQRGEGKLKMLYVTEVLNEKNSVTTCPIIQYFIANYVSLTCYWEMPLRP